VKRGGPVLLVLDEDVVIVLAVEAVEVKEVVAGIR
jgi:hypothetical protein